jgi:hypothetical protein
MTKTPRDPFPIDFLSSSCDFAQRATDPQLDTTIRADLAASHTPMCSKVAALTLWTFFQTHADKPGTSADDVAACVSSVINIRDALHRYGYDVPALNAERLAKKKPSV